MCLLLVISESPYRQVVAYLSYCLNKIRFMCLSDFITIWNTLSLKDMVDSLKEYGSRDVDTLLMTVGSPGSITAWVRLSIDPFLSLDFLIIYNHQSNNVFLFFFLVLWPLSSHGEVQAEDMK